MKLLSVLFVTLIYFIPNVSSGDSLGWSFKSPAFHYGNGYSQHVLSVEQLQFNRKKDLEDQKASEAAKIARQLENTTLNKFLKNVESRIYATLSKQMVDSMFAECGSSCASSGTAEIEGSQISWAKDSVTGEITLTVVGPDGTTEIKIPGSGEFNF